MEGLGKILKLEENTLIQREIFDNAENLPHNEQSVKCYKNDRDNYGKENHYMKINDNEESLPEKLEKSNMQRNQSYSIIEDSCIEYSNWGEHIKIDFTSVPGVDDNEFLQQKCIDFWKFVNKHPKLQSRVEIVKANESSSYETIMDKISEDQGCSQENEIPAVKALKHVDFQNVFATKQKYTLCEHSLNDYIIGKTKVEQRQLKLKKRATFSGLKPRSDSKNTKDKSRIMKSGGFDEVKKLCHKMDEWDLSHPKSMEPPNLAPSLKDLK